MLRLTVLLVFSVVIGTEGKMKPMTGVHLVVAVNDVSYYYFLFRVPYDIQVYWKTITSNIYSTNYLKDPPIFSIIKNANGSLNRYDGFPKYAFDAIAASLNFTQVFFYVLYSSRKFGYNDIVV